MIDTLKELIDEYGYATVYNAIDKLKSYKRKRNITYKTGITDEQFEEFKDAFEDFGFPIGMNSNGSIYIKIADTGTNYYNWRNAKGILYYLGYSNERNEYWIRYRNGDSLTPLHYDKHTRSYGFATFEEAMNYLLKLFNKKFS